MYSHDTTITTINSYYALCKNLKKGYKPTDDELFTVSHLDIKLARSIIEEFGENVALKLGKVLVASLQ